VKTVSAWWEKGVWALALCVTLALCLVFSTSCAPQEADDAAYEAAQAEIAEHEAVTVRVAVPVSLQGVVQELADSYAADKPWLSLEVEAFASAKQENAAITPVTPVEPQDGEAPTAPASESTAESSSAGLTEGTVDTDAEDAEESAPALLPEADVVFQSSASAMDAAEKLRAVDMATRADMLEDSLAIVASADSKLTSVSLADIEAGSYPLAVVTGKSLHAKRQNEVLEAIGVLADGEFSGYYATAEGAAVTLTRPADLFKAVSDGGDFAAIVRTSDIYRYGGVKVVGAVPARLYTAMRFPQALGANLSALENGAQVEEAARDFLNWADTSEDALRIIEKWGLRYVA
jgi:molybdate transport system substrate-binding protein